MHSQNRPKLLFISRPGFQLYPASMQSQRRVFIRASIIPPQALQILLLIVFPILRLPCKGQVLSRYLFIPLFHMIWVTGTPVHEVHVVSRGTGEFGVRTSGLRTRFAAADCGLIALERDAERTVGELVVSQHFHGSLDYAALVTRDVDWTDGGFGTVGLLVR